MINCNACSVYCIVSIIDKALNLTIQLNLCDLSIFKVVINNYIQYRQYNYRVTNDFVESKIRQVQFFTNLLNLNLNTSNNTAIYMVYNSLLLEDNVLGGIKYTTMYTVIF